MTLHFATTYFDDKAEDFGYLIGSDTHMKHIDREGNVSYEYSYTKSFRGSNHIGVHMGEIPYPIVSGVILFFMGPEHKKVVRRFKKQNLPWHDAYFNWLLSGIFDDIIQGRDYSDDHTIRDMNFEGAYHLLIGKRKDGKVELYTISNDSQTIEMKEDTALLLDQMDIGVLADKSVRSKFWLRGPGVPRDLGITPRGYVEQEGKRRLSFEAASEYMKRVLQLLDKRTRLLLVGKNKRYDSGPPDIHVVGNKRFGKLEEIVASSAEVPSSD